jgi:hypothetical protein
MWQHVAALIDQVLDGRAPAVAPGAARQDRQAAAARA